MPAIGQAAEVADDGRWTMVEADLEGLFDAHYRDGGALPLEGLALGQFIHDDYLPAGLGGNRPGAAYAVGLPMLTERPGSATTESRVP
jgi:hypothetical protein